MSFCLKCGKYSHGNKYCYECYQEELNYSLIKTNNKHNNCIKCLKKIDHLLYCEDCYKKHIALTIEDILLKYYNDFDSKREDLNRKRNRMLDISNEKCICCDNKAMYGSKYCRNHHPSFVDFSKLEPQKNEYTNTKKSNNVYCVYCKQPSYGNPYCYECYHKYYKSTGTNKITKYLKNRENNLCQFCCNPCGPYDICKNCYDFIKKNNKPYQRIKEYETKEHKNLNNDIYKNKQYVCENGYVVKSQGERTISDFLFKNNIPHEYERKLYYQEKNIKTEISNEKSIKPDFYIEGPVEFNGKILKNVFIEFFGIKGKEDYDKSNEYKKHVYKALSTTVIIVYPEDIEDYKKSLNYKLTHFTENRINFYKES